MTKLTRAEIEQTEEMIKAEIARRIYDVSSYGEMNEWIANDVAEQILEYLDSIGFVAPSAAPNSD